MMSTNTLEGAYTFSESIYTNSSSGIKIKLVLEDETHEHPYALYLIEPEVKRCGRIFKQPDGNKFYFDILDKDTGDKTKYYLHLDELNLTGYKVELIKWTQSPLTH